VVRPVRGAASVRQLGILLCGVLLAVGLTACNSADVRGPASATVAQATASASGADVKPFRSVRTYTGVAVPVRLRIPSQRINTSLQRLGQEADGTIAAPTEWQVAGWYDEGPRPGQKGPAVIVGHIDSHSGPAVFFRLPELKRGDAVYVDREDGTTVRFRVTGRRQVAKARFPAKAVYSPTLRASLLLITCGGSFDKSVGHYRDNIIVTAVPG
jgi:LPXTG-site transpeptidase (sortase) family protein